MPGPTGECEACRKKRLQRKRSDSTIERQNEPVVPPIVHEVLRSPGQPLDPKTRAFMEPRFGHDFGHVRVHTDARAAESARAASALAYTVGHNVVFGENKYAPASHSGRELLGHELAHTIQQRNASSVLSSSEQDGTFESSANAAAQNVFKGGVVSVHLPACGLQIQRAPATDVRWKNDVKVRPISRATDGKPNQKARQTLTGGTGKD